MFYFDDEFARISRSFSSADGVAPVVKTNAVLNWTVSKNLLSDIYACDLGVGISVKDGENGEYS